MKNTLSFLFLFFSSISFSQEFSLGISGGLNASYQVFDSNNIQTGIGANEGKPSLFVGTNINCKLNKLLSVRSGFNWQRKGGKDETVLTDENGYPLGNLTLANNIDYFQIPLLIEASFLKDRILFANIGYAFNFLQQAEYTVKGPSNFPDETEDTSDLYEKVDYSFLLGLGVKIPIDSSFLFTFEGRWDSGLTDVLNSELFVAKNRSVFAAVGIRYLLKFN